MKTIVLKGRKVVGGCAEGEALVTGNTISGWGGIDPVKGIIIERRHELRNISFAGKILVFPSAKGSSGMSLIFHIARMVGTAPKALIFNDMTTRAALTSVLLHAPAITGLDRDPLSIIETGDWVKVDSDKGVVEITKAGDIPQK
jgi:uncharacterized protein